MHHIGIRTLALALGIAAAPRAQAQNTNVVVCQDGTTAANIGLRTCAGRGGVNTTATTQGRRGTNGTVNGRVRCPDGTLSTSGIHGCGVQTGGVYGGTRRSSNGDVVYLPQRTDRRTDGRRDDDDDRSHKAKKFKHKDNGKHLGQWKHGVRTDRDRDDRR